MLLMNAQTVAIINFMFRRIFRFLIIFFFKVFFQDIVCRTVVNSCLVEDV